MIKEKYFCFVFCITIFPEKTQNKKQSRDEDDHSLMTKIHKAKTLKKFTFASGGTKVFF